VPTATPPRRSDTLPDPVRRLLAESDRHPLLTPAQERRLSRAASSGDRRARQELIESNLRLVVAIARRFTGLGLPLADLVQEGAIGLTHAADRFDWRRGSRFGTYAAWWIKQSIMRALSEQSRTIRLPHYLVAQQVTIRHGRAALETRLGRAPTAEEVAAETGLPVEAVELATVAAKAGRSLNDPVAGDGQEDGVELLELVPDPAAPDPRALAEAADERELVDEAVDHLPLREREVIRRHFGFGDGRGETLEAIATDLGVARERVRQVEQHALARLARELTRA
jgi:RNA polymerase primary sigma factor